ncbi:MAG TPA: hypothetical protein VGO06_13765 [Bosea sp. (in: a-proteobacteria)]|jgi:hypothetical protein|uniref:hypothetical protein n=1 Tax=Bosea sp. (in: a-proteobacteria) TaxID=1871050 RepID=UPI002E0F1E6D|nr:hypothetical protein [Bosea sp. (in: a-proteobacteria)]
MGKKRNGPTSTEDVLAWRRRRQHELAKAARQSSERSPDWKSNHGETVASVERTSSNRLDVNSYGGGAASIRDVGVIKCRK